MKNDQLSLHSVYQNIFLNALKSALAGMEDVIAKRILPEKMIMNEPEASYEKTEHKKNENN